MKLPAYRLLKGGKTYHNNMSSYGSKAIDEEPSNGQCATNDAAYQSGGLNQLQFLASSPYLPRFWLVHCLSCRLVTLEERVHRLHCGNRTNDHSDADGEKLCANYPD